MDPVLKKFIEKLLIFSIILGGVAWAIFNFAFPAYYFKELPFIFLLFISVSILVHSILLKAGKKRPARFSTDFMLSVIIKLFVYSSAVGLLIFLNKDAVKPMVITFLTMYFLYTFFEIKIILADLNDTIPPKKEEEK